jgi:translocation and assembly module TamB
MPSIEKNVDNKFNFRRILRVLGWILAILLGLVLIVLLAIQTSYVQNIARVEIVSYLNKKLNTKVEVRGLHIDFPKTIVLEGVYVQDLTKDTLIYGDIIKVDIDMYCLLWNELNMNEVVLEGITAKVKRNYIGTLFNYQFIIDAFAKKDTITIKKTTSPMAMSLDHMILKSTKFIYQDVVTGNDVDVFIRSSDIQISIFDPTNLVFNIPNIVIDGFEGKISQTKPLELIIKDGESENLTEKYLRLSNQHTSLKNIDLVYKNDISGLDTRFILKNADVYPRDIDLKNSFINIDKINIDDLNAKVALNSKSDSDLVQLTDTEGVDLNNNYLPWKVSVNQINLAENRVVFDDNTKKPLSQGMDYGHLEFSKLNFKAKDFMFHKDTVSVIIQKADAVEKTGFVLNQLQTSLLYTEKGATLNDLLIKTPGTEIKRNIKFTYPSLAKAIKDFSIIQIEMKLDNSQVQIKDILSFAPNLSSLPAFANTKDIFKFDADIDGSLTKLNIKKLLFEGFTNTKLDVSGVITNVMDTSRIMADLLIKHASTSMVDIKTLAPPNTLPKNITLPSYMSLSGQLKGGMTKIDADVAIRTSMGNATINGNINNLKSSSSADYKADMTLSSFQLGKMLQKEKTIGDISAQFNVAGKGYDPETAKMDVSGLINSVVYSNYNYKDLVLNANIDRQQIKTNGAIKDPNIHISFVGEGDLSKNFPCFMLTAEVDSIKTLPLNLTEEAVIYRGHVEADFPVLSLDSLQGNIYVSKSLLVVRDKRIVLDSIILEAKYQEQAQSIIARSDFAQAMIKGRYKLVQLGDIFLNAIEPYYAIERDSASVLLDDYDFELSGSVTDHSTIRAFLPDLKRLSPIVLAGAFSPAGWNVNATAPSIIYGTSKVSNFVFAAEEKNKELEVKLNASEIKNGENLNLINTRFHTDVTIDNIKYALRIGDKKDVDRYIVQGNVEREQNKTFNLLINPDSLLLNYDVWKISKDNSVRFGNNILKASDFDLSKDDQHLRLGNVDETSNSPLKVAFENFRLGTFTGFLQKDSLTADGIINGNILIKDIATLPNINANLGISDLSINKDTIGNLKVDVHNNIQNTFDANVSLQGRNNEAILSGKYYLKPKDKSEMDISIDIQKLQMKTIEDLSFGAIRNGKGFIKGKVSLQGKTVAPDIDGSIGFNDASMVVAMLNNEFKVDNEQIIAVDNVGLKFNRFTVRDAAENRLTINGSVLTTNYVNYQFDLNLRANNFQGLNSSQINSKLYYGKLFFDTNLRITGTENAPVVDGTLRVNEDTDMTIVLPQEQPGILDREGIVVFVDKDATVNDSLFLQSVDSLNTSSILGMDVSLNIEVDKKATLTMVLDEANGDFIKLKGEALLNGGIDKSGKITLTGSYELDEGAYEMSFNLIKRKFVIQKGSKITWAGEPTDGNLDVSAIYIANTSAADLVQDQVAAAKTDLRYRQRLPFEVQLNMDGPLLRPLLTFEIKLPKESSVRVDSDISSQVEMRLNQLNAEPSELSKQVYALLILNRFVADNPFESASGGISAESMARQSVSKILSQQLNNLAANLVKGVEIDFDVVSSEDYTSGNLENRTDLNVGVSKRLFNERLNVSVGTNIALEGGQQNTQATNAGNSTSPNINIEYMLSSDGRYLVRAYRKNEYEGVVEGFVVETGVGFVMSVEYDKFKEIFQRAKERRSNRNWERNNRDKSGTPSSDSLNNPPAGNKKSNR